MHVSTYIIPLPLNLNQFQPRQIITSAASTIGHQRRIFGFVFATCIPYAANNIKNGQIGIWNRLE